MRGLQYIMKQFLQEPFMLTNMFELRHRADAGSEQLPHDASRRTEILHPKVAVLDVQPRTQSSALEV